MIKKVRLKMEEKFYKTVDRCELLTLLAWDKNEDKEEDGMLFSNSMLPIKR